MTAACAMEYAAVSDRMHRHTAVTAYRYTGNGRVARASISGCAAQVGREAP